jgi:hypothetical protein
MSSSSSRQLNPHLVIGVAQWLGGRERVAARGDVLDVRSKPVFGPHGTSSIAGGIDVVQCQQVASVPGPEREPSDRCEKRFVPVGGRSLDLRVPA